MTEGAQRAAVVAEAMRWLGTPWVHEARILGAGVDCGQLLVAVFEGAGVVSRAGAPESYPQDWGVHRSEEIFLQIVERHARRLDDDEPRLPGDVLLFRFGRCLSHGGIVTEWPRFIHAYLNARRVVEDDLERAPDLARRLAGAWSSWPKEGQR